VTELRASFQQNGRRNLLMTRELLRILRLFEDHSIPALTYKGPALAELAYGNLALRTFADVDVLVRRRDRRRATEILDRHGYRPTPTMPMTEVQKRVVDRFPCERVFLDETGLAKVDLHWDILPRMLAFGVAPEVLLGRSEDVPLGGTQVRTLSPEDLLLVLCAHNTKHRWERLGWICDVARLVERCSMRWGEVFARARALGCDRMISLGLVLANGLLGAVLPPDVADRAYADGRAGMLAVRIAGGLFAGAGALAHHVEDARFYLSARERFRDRARVALRAVSTPTSNEVALVALPAALSFLYYPLRPLRLALKFTRSPRRV
jgi:hypothetical protein